MFFYLTKNLKRFKHYNNNIYINEEVFINTISNTTIFRN